ncbi:MAG: ribosome silencing factor [Betaproteobacteria bacterium]|nr:ribosome silencing factor [Betaproteobacteria bacterium]
MRIDKLVKATVAALEDIKAHDIVVLDVKRMTSLFDKMIIASGDSTRQTKALSNNVQEKLKALGARIYGVEGEQAGEWILVDLGAVVVHIMQPAVRRYYSLEELWSPLRRARRRRAAASAVRG